MGPVLTVGPGSSSTLTATRFSVLDAGSPSGLFSSTPPIIFRKGIGENVVGALG